VSRWKTADRRTPFRCMPSTARSPAARVIAAAAVRDGRAACGARISEPGLESSINRPPPRARLRIGLDHGRCAADRGRGASQHHADKLAIARRPASPPDRASGRPPVGREVAAVRAVRSLPGCGTVPGPGARTDGSRCSQDCLSGRRCRGSDGARRSRPDTNSS
jgi:hypothetical protein